VLAEYIARDLFEGIVLFESAGFAPQAAADARNAIDTLRLNFGIDAENHVPRDVRSLDLGAYTLIIALDRRVAKRLIQEVGLPGPKVKLWNINDPYGADPSEYDRSSLEIKKRVLQLRASGGGRRDGAR
jgi:protein-tyrosine-phosphatase